jgi:sugar phosphate isomerase/epimerase
LKNDIDIILSNKIKICNLFTEPISSFEIIKMFDYPVENFKNNSKITYNIKTKYSKLFLSNKEGYIRDKESILHNLKIFIKFQKIDKTNLIVSNICVNDISQFQFACILKLYGIENVQIAPTKLIDNWNNLQNMDLNIFKNRDINIYSFQSVTYGLNSNIFDYETKQSLLDHLKKIINYSILNNIQIIVFGCPRNRKILNKNDNDNDNNNNNIFCEFFNELGNYIGENNLKICIEPNSKKYGCNYLNNIKEAGDIVRKINNKNIKLMIDIGNIIMENDNIDEIYNYKDILYNIDISTENMEPFINNNINNKHNELIKILKKINYNKKINLEILIKENKEELNLLFQSLNNFILLFI